jgi:hypothetical protein
MAAFTKVAAVALVCLRCRHVDEQLSAPRFHILAPQRLVVDFAADEGAVNRQKGFVFDN